LSLKNIHAVNIYGVNILYNIWVKIHTKNIALIWKMLTQMVSSKKCRYIWYVCWKLNSQCRCWIYRYSLLHKYLQYIIDCNFLCRNYLQIYLQYYNLWASLEPLQKLIHNPGEGQESCTRLKIKNSFQTILSLETQFCNFEVFNFTPIICTLFEDMCCSAPRQITGLQETNISSLNIFP